MKFSKLYIIAALVMLITSACGKKDEQQTQAAPAPAPSAPAPAPATPAPPPPPPTIAGTNCPVVNGTMPLNQNGSLFYGHLFSAQSGNSFTSNNILTLNVQLNNYTSLTAPGQNVVGSGSLYLPDLAMLNRYPIANQNYNICISSATVTNGAPAIPGTYRIQDGSIQMVLQGTIQVPTSPTYYGSPYPQTGAPTFTTDTIQVFVGQDCPAYLQSSYGTPSIIGCVTVQIGNPSYGGPVLRYQSR